VVDSGSKNMEVVVVRDGQAMSPVSEDDVEAVNALVLAEVEAAKTAAAGAGEMKE
jgi:hypothetical protein